MPVAVFNNIDKVMKIVASPATTITVPWATIEPVFTNYVSQWMDVPNPPVITANEGDRLHWDFKQMDGWYIAVGPNNSTQLGHASGEYRGMPKGQADPGHRETWDPSGECPPGEYLIYTAEFAAAGGYTMAKLKVLPAHRQIAIDRIYQGNQIVWPVSTP